MHFALAHYTETFIHKRLQLLWYTCIYVAAYFNTFSACLSILRAFLAETILEPRLFSCVALPTCPICSQG